MLSRDEEIEILHGLLYVFNNQNSQKWYKALIDFSDKKTQDLQVKKDSYEDGEIPQDLLYDLEEAKLTNILSKTLSACKNDPVDVNINPKLMAVCIDLGILIPNAQNRQKTPEPEELFQELGVDLK